MEIDRITFEIYWSYYKSIENMFITTMQYVSPSKANKETYSDEYTKIIFLCGSEIDSILKLICKLENILPEYKNFKMKDYAEIFERYISLKTECYCPRCMTSVDEESLMITPFNKIQIGIKYSGLDWWEDYQSLKHNRMENAKKGNLQNAASMLTAHYILIRFLIKYLGKNYGINYVKEHNVSSFLIPCL